MSGLSSHSTFASGASSVPDAPGRPGRRPGERRQHGGQGRGFAPAPHRTDAGPDGNGPVRRLVCAWAVEPGAASRSARAVFNGPPGFEIAVGIDAVGVRDAAWRWTGLAQAEGVGRGALPPAAKGWTPFACVDGVVVTDARRGLLHVRVPGLIEITAAEREGVRDALFVRSAMLERLLADGGVAGGRCEFAGLELRSRADSAA